LSIQSLANFEAEDDIDLEIAWFDVHQRDDVGSQQHSARLRKRGNIFGRPLAVIGFGS